MAAKPFASSADLGVKEQTLEVLADGVYALTAEGDPNLGAIEGEDFLVCFEALATPVAARDWLAQAARAHRQAGPLPRARRTTTPCGCSGASAFDAEVIVAHEQTRHADRRARPAGLGERVRPDAAAVRGARVDPRPDLADADLQRQAHHRARRRPGRPGAASSCGRGHTEGDIVAWLPQQQDPLRRRPGRVAGRPLHRRRLPPATGPTGTLDRVKALGARAAHRRPRRGRPGPRGRRRRDRADPRLPAHHAARGGRGARERGGTLKEAFAATHARPRPDSTGDWPIFEHCLPFDVSRLWDELAGIERPVIWTAERDREVWDQLQG